MLIQKCLLFISLFCTIYFLLTETFLFAVQTFVITADVVFVRQYPKKPLPNEDMSIEQLEKESYIMDFSFIPHFFYGENVTGEIDRENPGLVKVKVYWKDQQKETTGYMDIKKLWQQPPLASISANLVMALQDETKVYLIPEKNSREVLSLYQGEVVEAVGQLKHAGILWIKARFDSAGGTRYGYRYGYIEAKNLQLLYPGKIDEGNLTPSEIPKKMRYSHLPHLSEEEREKLARDGFYIEPGSSPTYLYVDEMVDLYHNITTPVFVSSDLFLHSLHLIFDRMLQDIERKKIFPEIQSLTLELVKETKKDLKSSAGVNDKIQKALLHNLFFFSVAAKLFNPGFVIPEEIRSDVESIVERIVKAEGPLPSLQNKIQLGEEDFTQYRVRGHYQSKPYQKSKRLEELGIPLEEKVEEDPDLLERYFRGMIWYGRHSFLLSDDIKTLSAILIVRALERSEGVRSWEKIDAVLTQLMGKTDDWSPRDYRKLNEIIFKTRIPSIEDISKGGDKVIKEFREKAVQILSKQKIVSMQTRPSFTLGEKFTQEKRLEKTAGFKFLGQRFTWDGYIFNQLTSPSVGTDANPRNLPSALDVMSILGSKGADGITAEINSQYQWENYDSQLGKLKKEIGGEIEKKETAYNSWIHTLTALFLPTKSKQVFAIKEPWQFKSLNTALGSWTELNHDTILYTEQSYAEMGEGSSFEVPPYAPPYDKGYIEPNPIFFSRLREMVLKILSSLQKKGFLTDEYSDKLQTFESVVQRAYEIVKKEVEGSPVTRYDYQWINNMSRYFDRSLLLPRDAGDTIDPDYLRMAVIADVATDAFFGRVLEVAVGIPQRIIMVVKDAYGGTRITVGYVYSWYEFDDTKRWTDTEWKKIVYSPDIKDQAKLKELKPSWYSKFQK